MNIQYSFSKAIDLVRHMVEHQPPYKQHDVDGFFLSKELLKSLIKEFDART